MPHLKVSLSPLTVSFIFALLIDLDQFLEWNWRGLFWYQIAAKIPKESILVCLKKFFQIAWEFSTSDKSKLRLNLCHSQFSNQTFGWSSPFSFFCSSILVSIIEMDRQLTLHLAPSICIFFHRSAGIEKWSKIMPKRWILLMLTQYYFVFIANTKDSIGFHSFVAANEKQRCKKTGIPFATLILMLKNIRLKNIILSLDFEKNCEEWKLKGTFSKRSTFFTPLDKIKANSTRIDGGSDLILLYCIRKKRKKESMAISFPLSLTLYKKAQ